jgi:LacI family transcriptional regulator
VERGRVTVKDVAARAGVSTASVSRVLTGHQPVAPDIVQQVRQAAAELGYQVNAAGRSLRRRSTETVGLVVADVTNPYFPELIKEVEVALATHGLGLLLADSANDVAQERLAVSRLLARQVDALLVTPVSRSRSRRLIAEAMERCKVIQIDRRTSAHAHYVGMDNVAAIELVMEHLATQGRSRPVFIGSDPQISTTWERQRRFQDFAGLTDRVLVGDFSLAWGSTAAALALDRWPDADAFVCADDLVAVGALEYLKRAGVGVPSAIAVIGFDDTLLARVGNPTITSVRQPLAVMAEAAASLVSTPDEGGVKVMKFSGELVVRTSSSGPEVTG